MEFSATVTELGNVFNTFRKSESKEDALGHLWKSFSTVTKNFNADEFISNDNKFVQLAASIAKKAARNVAISGGLAAMGTTEGISVIPALFESVIEGVVGLFQKDKPSNESFFAGEWVSVQSGFIKDTNEDRMMRTEMFGDDDLILEMPEYDVGFFIKYTDGDRSVVFDAQQGKVITVPSTDIRSIPDQFSLDDNEFLRDLKLLYFREEGKDAIAKTNKEVSIGKKVTFEDALWDIIEWEPAKQIAHLVRNGEIVEAGIKAIETLDQDNQLTWLTKKTTESFPNTLIKFGFCWKQEENVEVLCCVSEINGNFVDIVKCLTGDVERLPDTSLRAVSSRFSELISSLPEFRRFKNSLIFERRVVPIYTFRHLCTESVTNKFVDKIARKELISQYKTEKTAYNTVDPDIREKVRELELAYNERLEVMEDEVGVYFAPARKYGE